MRCDGGSHIGPGVQVGTGVGPSQKQSGQLFVPRVLQIKPKHGPHTGVLLHVELGGGVEIGEGVALTAAAAVSLGVAVVASTWAAMKTLNAAMSTRRATTVADIQSPPCGRPEGCREPEFCGRCRVEVTVAS